MPEGMVNNAGRNFWIRNQLGTYDYDISMIDYVYYVKNTLTSWSLKARMNTGITALLGTEESESNIKAVRDNLVSVLVDPLNCNGKIEYPYV